MTTHFHINHQSPNQMFSYLIKKYFRVKPHVPADVYISAIKNKPYYIRQQLAKVSYIPEVVEALVNDVDPLVGETARQNEYWLLLGQFKSLLKLPKEEKFAFIEKDNFNNLLVFLIFETDPDVLEKIFLHPSISLQMLNTYYQFLMKRGFGPSDEIILERVKRVIEIKKNRIVKVSKILHFAKFNTSMEFFWEIAPYILDTDEMIRTALIENLSTLTSEQFIRYFEIRQEFLTKLNLNNLNFWLIAQEFTRLLSSKGLTFTDVVSETGENDKTFSKIIDTLIQFKLMILHRCSDNLSLRENLLPLAYAHTDTHADIQRAAAEILDLDELIFLIREDSFPQALGREVFRILKRHPSAEVQKKLSEIFIIFGERTRKKLREMETSINAYFDIIFSSLGYPQISKLKQATHILKSARDLTDDFLNGDSQNGTISRREIDILYQRIEKFYQRKILEIHLQMNENYIKDLREIYDILLILLKIPEKIVKEEGYQPEIHGGEYQMQLQKTKLLWRATISQYLNRIQELNLILQKKWMTIIHKTVSSLDFNEELNSALAALEKQYKNQVNCHLTIACKVCEKRNCASERFLRQMEFLIGEMLDVLEIEEFDMEIASIEK